MESRYFEKLGLNRPPFEETTSPAFFSETSASKAILAAVKDQAKDGGMVLIKGSEGCGKSILAHMLAAALEQDSRVLSLSVPPTASSDGADGANNPDIGGTTNTGIEQVAGQIVEAIADSPDKKCVVIVDQAQHLSTDDLIAFQLNIGHARERGLSLTIALIASERIEQVLRAPELKLIAKSMSCAGELTPLNGAEAERYIKDRLKAGGAKGSKIFANKAIRRIAELSGGVPRQINDLAKRAMHLAAERDQAPITASIVAACAQSTNQQNADAGIAPQEIERTSMPRMEAGKVEGLVKQLQNVLAQVPAAVGDGAIPGDTKTDAVDTFLDLAEGAGEADARVAQLSDAVRNAEATHTRLVDFAEALSRIGTSTDERIELLLTSLESAQQIHEELELIGDQARGLIAESRQSVTDEHDKMLAQLGELSARREELSIIIDQFKSEQDDVLRETQRDLEEKIEAVRDNADRTCNESKCALNKADSALKAFDRHLKESTGLGEALDQKLDDARQLHDALAKTFAQTRKDLSAHRENAKAATAAQMECVQATEAAESVTLRASKTKDQLSSIAENANTQRKALGQAVTDAKTTADEIVERLDQTRGELDNRHENILGEIRQAGDGIQKRLAAGVAEVGRLTETAQESINTATCAIDDQRGVAVKAIESCQKDAQVSIQTTGHDVEARITDSMRRLEQMLAAEEAAGKRAADASEHAAAMMTRVSQSEAKLAETQESIFNIEAVAAEALASVQARLKKMHDAVDVIVDQGAARVRTMLDENLASFQDEALNISESISKSAADVREQMRTGAEQAQTTFDAQQRAARETVEQAATSIDELASSRITDARDTISLIALEAQATLEQQQLDVIGAIDTHAASSDQRMSLQTQARTEEIDRQMEARSSASIAAIQKVASESSDCISRISEEIDKKSHAVLASMEDTALTSSERAEKRVNEAALSAARAIQDKIASATETVRTLDEAIVNGNDTVANTDDRREKVNQLIQEVWSLTSTTDHRARALEALSTKAKAHEDHIGTLVDQAVTRITQLGEQNQTAEQCSNTLAVQREQLEALSGNLGEQLGDATTLHRELSQANAAGKQLETSMAAHAEEIQGLVATAENIVQTIREDEESAAQISAAVKHASDVAATVEVRLNELQQSLADPISTIQNAKGQADELNELYLAVKRIFRSVSQASLDANERIKMMGKMLTATHKTAETMKQWVAEADRSRARLEASIQQAPSISETHPLTAMPDAAMPNDWIPKPAGAGDLATVTKMANSPKQSAAKPGTKTVKLEGPKAADAGERMEPAAAVKRANRISVATNGKKPVESTAGETSPKRNRLSPEDVRSLIEAAKNKSAMAG
ncbi:MAG: AAA family ATPase [Planctomycetes bacterium]|nr:AAA family ATPase [Planctomycetota bacterium]